MNDVAIIHPAAATVGDPITIDFPAGPVAINASPDYEIVSQQGTHAILRTFKAKPFTVSGRMGAVPFRGLTVPVRSVLKANDPLDPAPLVAPHGKAWPKTPTIAIGVIAAIAIAALVAWLIRRRKRPTVVIPVVPPAERFRATVTALLQNPNAPMRWARLADAVRDLFDGTGVAGHELTTSEVVGKVDDPLVREILRQGDLEKFSPWGAKPDDFVAAAEGILRVARAFEPAPSEGAERGPESPRHTGAAA